MEVFRHEEGGRILFRDLITERLTPTNDLRVETALSVHRALTPVKRAVLALRISSDDEASFAKAYVRDGQDPQWEISLVSGSVNYGFSLNHCFAAIEEELFKGGQALLNQMLKSAYGLNFPKIDRLEITCIQSGHLNGIFKIDCICGDQEYALVATVSRDPSLNENLIDDHEELTRLRELEAEAYGMDPFSRDFSNRCSIVPHVGVAFPEPKSGRPAMYFAPFIENAFELNLEFDTSETGESIKTVLMNGQNQSQGVMSFDPESSSQMMTSIALLHLKYAYFGGRAIESSMRAGDFLFNLGTKKLWWHCYRDPVFMASSISPNMFHFSLLSMKDSTTKIEAMALQTLQLLLTSELGIQDNPLTSELRPVYGSREVLEAVGYCLKLRMIGRDDLQRIVDYLKSYDPMTDRHFPLHNAQLGELRDGFIVRQKELVEGLEGLALQ